MSIQLGMEGVLKIDGKEIKNCKDLTLNISNNMVDVTTRGNNGWRAYKPALRDAELTFTVLNKTGDTAFADLATIESEKREVEVEVSDTGVLFKKKMTIETFSHDQSLEDAISAEVTMKPADDPEEEVEDDPMG